MKNVYLISYYLIGVPILKRIIIEVLERKRLRQTFELAFDFLTNTITSINKVILPLLGDCY